MRELVEIEINNRVPVSRGVAQELVQSAAHKAFQINIKTKNRNTHTPSEVNYRGTAGGESGGMWGTLGWDSLGGSGPDLGLTRMMDALVGYVSLSMITMT